MDDIATLLWYFFFYFTFIIWDLSTNIACNMILFILLYFNLTYFEFE
jgi:hypothetical protein